MKKLESLGYRAELFAQIKTVQQQKATDNGILL